MDSEIENFIEADYIEVPLLLRWKLGSGGGGLVLFGGPAVSFRMNAKSIAQVGEEAPEEDIKEQTNGTDFGAVVGAGLSFGKIGFEGRYNLGMSSFFVESDQVKFRWGTISLLMSIGF